jgi:transcriptional regulator with XRE-family HTH domain
LKSKRDTDRKCINAKEEVLDFLGKNLRYLREKRGFSLERLATKLKITKSALCSYEHGNACPSIFILRDIAYQFEVSIDDIINHNLVEKEKEKDQLETVFSRSISNDSCLPFGDRIYNKFINQKYWLYFLTRSSDKPLGINQSEMIIRPNMHEKVYEVKWEIDNSEKKYVGNLVLTYAHIYIYLRGIEHYERAIIILNNPQNSISKPYIGGIGIFSSITSGWEKNPCMQKIIISYTSIPTNNELMDKLCSQLSFPSDASWMIKISHDSDYETYKFIKEIMKEYSVG